MIVTVTGATPRGVGALFVRVEVDRHRSGLPAFTVVGLPDTAVRESRDRIGAAIRQLGGELEPATTVVNLAPADERKEGAGLDLPMAIGVLAAAGRLPAEALRGVVLVGELSLDGRLRPVRGALPMALAAAAHRVRELIVPRANGDEAAVVDGVTVRAAGSLGEVVRHLRGEDELPPARVRERPSAPPEVPDLADVVGQEQARRALEVAAAGGHHLLMIGPPGAGKSMLARRLPGILPPLERAEALEATCLASVSRRVPRPDGLLTVRPFRAPHHSTSTAALIGGGTDPSPGEVSLAHAGVLFLDELTEFRRDVLESLRQPLEDGRVTVSRSAASATFPCRFQLVAAANPCPCGFLGDRRRTCTCSGSAVARYRSRLSGPLLDRIDLQVVLPAVGPRDLAGARPGEATAPVADRVTAARRRQRSRYAAEPWRSNAEIPAGALARWAAPDDDGRRLLERAADRLALSARSYHRTLRVGRTVADLDGSDRMAARHLAEALAYRWHETNPPVTVAT